MEINWSEFTESAGTQNKSESASVDWSEFTEAPKEQITQTVPVFDQPSKQPSIFQTTNIPEGNPDPALATVGTLANIGADLGKGTADTAAFILNSFNLISNEKAQSFYDSTKQGADLLRPSKEDVIGQAVEKYPIATTIGRAAGDLVGLLRGQGLLGRGLIGQTVMGGLTSQTMGDTVQEKNIYGGVGAAGQPILSAIGWGVKQIALKTSIGTRIKEVVSEAAKQIKGYTVTDDMGESVANMYRTTKKVNDELYAASTANNPIHTLSETPKVGQELSAKYGMSKEATSTVLGDLAPGVKQYITDMNAMASSGSRSSHELLQNYYAAQNLTNQAYKAAKNGRLNYDVAKDIKKLQDAAERDLEAALQKEGNFDKYLQAKQYNKDNLQPLKDFNADEITEAFLEKETNPSRWNAATKSLYKQAVANPQGMKAALKAMDSEGKKIMERGILSETLTPVLDNIDDFNYASAYTQLNKSIRMFKGILSDESMEVFEGTAKLIKEAGAQSKHISMAGHIGSIAAGGSIGGYIGQKMGGDEAEGKVLAGGIGGAVGIIGFPIIIHGIKALLHTAKGQEMLINIARDKGNKSTSDMIRTLWSSFLPSYIRATTPNKENTNGN